jgi:glycosyltransferase involved in cell wall biosynthesis
MATARSMHAPRRIALIGNMNNNNFALMRFFRDLGADAHLLLYLNDGEGNSSHFRPESDTWEFERWQPFIHRTGIPNAPVAALDFPISLLMSARSRVRSWVGKQDAWMPAVSKKQIRAAYEGFNRYVGSGITPATMIRAGLPLHIFYPYSTGVEFVSSPWFVPRFNKRRSLEAAVYALVRQRQIEGIRASQRVLNGDVGLTEQSLTAMGVQPVRLNIPMVYNLGTMPEAPPTTKLEAVWEAVESCSFTVLHHSRLMWRNPGGYTETVWREQNKNNHWLLAAFAAFVRARPGANARLLVVEYGPDVKSTKKYAAELGLNDHVLWISKMERRELMWLLSRVSVGAGEFYERPRMIWGGTGWETLASGKPLLQGFSFAPGEFETIYGHPPPPLLPVRSEAEILAHLNEMADNPERRHQIGNEARLWFDRYNGVALANQWLDLLVNQPEDLC